jgi:hypothetical protein
MKAFHEWSKREILHYEAENIENQKGFWSMLSFLKADSMKREKENHLNVFMAPNLK